MKQVTVEAFNGVGNKATKAGERTIKVPESIEEAVETYTETEVLKGFMKSYVIAVQAEIRRGTNGNPNLSKFKSLSKDKQAELLALVGDNKS